MLTGDPQTARLVPIVDIFNLQIGKGDFTCCRNGHQKGEPCDKEDVSAFITLLLDKNIDALHAQMLRLKAGALFEDDKSRRIALRYRFLFSFRRYMLAGLPVGKLLP